MEAPTGPAKAPPARVAAPAGLLGYRAAGAVRALYSSDLDVLGAATSASGGVSTGALLTALAASEAAPATRSVVEHFTRAGVTTSLVKISVLKGLAFLGTGRLASVKVKTDAEGNPLETKSQAVSRALGGREFQAVKLVAKKLSEGVAKDMGKDLIKRAAENAIIRTYPATFSSRFVKSKRMVELLQRAACSLGHHVSNAAASRHRHFPGSS